MMKKNMLVFISFFLVTNVFGAYNLSITIESLRNSSGTIFLELLDEQGDTVKELSSKIKNNRCLIVIENLKPGTYGFKYFHDENNNKTLDVNWLNIPLEEFGFSNNSKGVFGPPAFNKTLFSLNEHTYLNCYPICYF